MYRPTLGLPFAFGLGDYHLGSGTLQRAQRRNRPLGIGQPLVVEIPADDGGDPSYLPVHLLFNLLKGVVLLQSTLPSLSTRAQQLGHAFDPTTDQSQLKKHVTHGVQLAAFH